MRNTGIRKLRLDRALSKECILHASTRLHPPSPTRHALTGCTPLKGHDPTSTFCCFLVLAIAMQCCGQVHTRCIPFSNFTICGPIPTLRFVAPLPQEASKTECKRSALTHLEPPVPTLRFRAALPREPSETSRLNHLCFACSLAPFLREPS